MAEKITVGLIGNPNCGKTTIFNVLTGARQHALLLIPMLLLVLGHTHTHSHEHHKVEYEHLHEHYNEQEHDHEHHEHEHNHNYKNKLIVDIMNNKITWQAYQS